MDYKVEELGPLKKKVVVTVPGKDVNLIIDRIVAKYRSSVAIPGFRKGKAPVGMVEKQFGRDIYPEATNLLVDNQVRNIVEELKIEPASGIEFDEPGLVERDKEFGYFFIVEAMPEFELPNYQDFPAEQENVDVEASEID
ncbi:trigger factor family protein, partial [Desulfovibrio sp. OttesenSCG-928-F07]|nr:trigger factor family protein [Desulfovibrio sp. OttesenSCG-928-F07]